MSKTHRFRIGNTVYGCLSADSSAVSVPYKVRGLMPERDGKLQYRIESDVDGHQRVATEDLLFGDRKSAEQNRPPGPRDMYSLLSAGKAQ